MMLACCRTLPWQRNAFAHWLNLTSQADCLVARSALRGLLLLALLGACAPLGGCGLFGLGQPDRTPAKVTLLYAYDAANTVYSPSAKLNSAWAERLEHFDQYAVPVLERLSREGHGFRLSVEPMDDARGRGYFLTAEVLQNGDAEAAVLVTEASKVPGVPAPLLRLTEEAFAELAVVLLDVDAAQRLYDEQAFALLVRRQQGRQHGGDPAAEGRPLDLVEQDFQQAFSIYETQQQRADSARAGVLGLVALSDECVAKQCIEIVRKSIAEDLAVARRWRADQRKPGLDEYTMSTESGMTLSEELLTRYKERPGFFQAVAKAAVTAAFGGGLGSLKELLPEHSDAREVFDALQAASKKDIAGVLTALGRLVANHNEHVAQIENRLKEVQQLGSDVRRTVDDVKDTAKGVKDTAKQVKDTAKGVKDTAKKVQQGGH